MPRARASLHPPRTGLIRIVTHLQGPAMTAGSKPSRCMHAVAAKGGTLARRQRVQGRRLERIVLDLETGGARLTKTGEPSRLSHETRQLRGTQAFPSSIDTSRDGCDRNSLLPPN